MSTTNKHHIEDELKSLLLPGLRGDSLAYRRFLHSLTGRLRAFLRRRLMHYPDHIEDVLQETLLAIHNARHTYDTAQPLTSWVYAIAKYKLMDFLRYHTRHAALTMPLDDYADDILICVDEQPAQAKREVGELLQLLPDRQSLPIRHVKLEGLSVKETALLTGLSESAVKIGVFRGLRTLARKIQGET